MIIPNILALDFDGVLTLQHVTTHADLADVALFLAAWGDNTPEMCASVRSDGRIP